MARERESSGARWWRGPVVMLLGVAALIALSSGIASILSVGPRSLLERWDSDGRVGSEAEWRGAMRLLDLAATLNPLDAAIPFDQGRFHHWRAAGFDLLDERRHGELLLAERDYRRALSLRPKWSLAWVYLADALTLDRRLSKGGLAALREVLAIDPHGTFATQRALELSAMAWRLLSADERCRVAGIIAYRDAWKGSWASIGDDARERVMRHLPEGALDPRRLASVTAWLVERQRRYNAASFIGKLRIGLAPRERFLDGRYCSTRGVSDAENR